MKQRKIEKKKDATTDFAIERPDRPNGWAGAEKRFFGGSKEREVDRVFRDA